MLLSPPPSPDIFYRWNLLRSTKGTFPTKTIYMHQYGIYSNSQSVRNKNVRFEQPPALSGADMQRISEGGGAVYGNRQAKNAPKSDLMWWMACKKTRWGGRPPAPLLLIDPRLPVWVAHPNILKHIITSNRIIATGRCVRGSFFSLFVAADHSCFWIDL